MKSYNFCPECGKSLENDSNICPNCGFKIISELKEHASTINEQIRREPVLIPKITQKAKPLKKRMGFLSWILLIIGAIIGLYALFTPAGTIKVGDIFSWDMW
ncbi:MAG: zinc-ribbon domain-containing protein, partial [Promethearchaeota archaeon]